MRTESRVPEGLRAVWRGSVGKFLEKSWSRARRHPVVSGVFAVYGVCVALVLWMLAPPQVMEHLKPPAAAGSPAPEPPVIHVKPEPDELCSSNVNRHPALPVAQGRFWVNPNEWNATGGLCIRSNGGTDFRVTQSGVTGRTMVDPMRGPGAYAHITTPPRGGMLPIRVDKLRYATSSWRTSTVDAGTYNAAYDLWFSSVPGKCSFTESAELMIWLDSRNKRPSGTLSQRQARIGEVAYNVFETPRNGAHTLIVYQSTVATESVTDLDLRAFARDAAERGYVPWDSELCSVQAGFEVWDGGVGLSTESFTFDAAAGLPAGAITSALPGMCLALPDGSRTPVVESCDGTPAQNWSRTEGHALAHAGGCLEAGRGGSLWVADCSGAPAQRWDDGEYGSLVNKASGQCLDARGAEPRASVVPRARSCDRSAEQTWHLPL